MRTIVLIALLAITSLTPAWSSETVANNDDGNFRRYTLIFSTDGQTSKGDIAADPAAELIGEAGSVVATSPTDIKLVQGAVTINTGKAPVNVELTNNSQVSIDSHSQLAVRKNDSRFHVLLLKGSGKLSTPDGVQDLVLTTKASDDHLSKKGNSEPIRLLAGQGTQFLLKNDGLHMKNGIAFLHMPGDIPLVTPGGIIRSTKPYSVSYRMLNDALCIENCTPTESVFLEVRGESIKLCPYRSCILEHRDGESAAAPGDGVLRRNVIAKTDGVFTVLLAEYDPYSLLETHPAVNRALKHPITAFEQKMSDALIKHVAVFEELCGDVNSFQAEPKTSKVEMLGYFKNPLKFEGIQILQ